jgi:hypothetical protein
MKKDKEISYCECGNTKYFTAKECRSCANRTRYKKDDIKTTRRSLKIAIRSLPDYKMWKEIVMGRDGFICRGCQATEKLDIHHLYKEFDDIIVEFTEKYKDFLGDRRTLISLAATYQPFWEVKNGVCVCRKCHLLCHSGDLKLEN